MAILLSCDSKIERDYTLCLYECVIFSNSPEPAALYGGCCGAAQPFLRAPVEQWKLFQGAVFMKSSYNGKTVPSEGQPIGYSGGELQVPDTPIINNWRVRHLQFAAAVTDRLAFGGDSLSVIRTLHEYGS